MDQCAVRVRVRDARGDDVKATTIKEKKKKKKKKKKENKKNICLLYMEMFPSQNPI